MTKAKRKLKARVEHLKDFISRSVAKAGKKGIVLGLSGGMDSSVCLYLAAGALGEKCCRAFYMPHRGDGEIREEAKLLCSELGVKLEAYNLTPITEKFADMSGATDPVHKGNFGARLRTAFLYQHAAAEDLLVVNTSNKSEIMTGYFTKWGDEAGDISPLGNYYKSEVVELARYLGLPQKILEGTPSADFFEAQKDEEELGISYSKLDRILECIARGQENQCDVEEVVKVKRLIEKSSHKRHSPIKAERID